MSTRRLRRSLFSICQLQKGKSNILSGRRQMVESRRTSITNGKRVLHRWMEQSFYLLPSTIYNFKTTISKGLVPGKGEPPFTIQSLFFITHQNTPELYEIPLPQRQSREQPITMKNNQITNNQITNNQGGLLPLPQIGEDQH